MKYFHTFFLLFFALPLFSQVPGDFVQFDYPKTSSGLGNILSASYDESGFLWVAGQTSDVVGDMFVDGDGVLERFDGNRFQNIPMPDFGIPINRITQIIKNKEGVFYLSCSGSDGNFILAMDPYTLSFERIDFPGKEKGIKRLSNIFEYSGRYFLLIQEKDETSLFEIVGTTTKKITSFKIPENTLINVATDFIPYKNSFLVSIISSGVYLYDWEGNLLKSPTELYASEKAVFWINNKWTFRGEEYFMLNNSPVLYQFLPEEEKIKPAFDFKEEIGTRDFRFWGDEMENLMLFINNKENLEVHEITKTGLEQMETLPSEKFTGETRFFSKDITKSLWVFNPGSPISFYWFFQNKLNRFLPDKSIRSLYPLDNDRILVSTELSGWYEIDLKNNIAEPFQTFYQGRAASIDYTRNIIPAKDSGHIWANYRYGLAKVNVETRKMEYWESVAVESLARLDSTTLVYGTYRQSLMAFDTETKQSRPLVATDSLWILQLETNAGTIYAGTDKGLLIYEEKSQTAHLHVASENSADNYFLSSLKDIDKSLLLGSKSGKVYRFHTDTKTFDLIYEDKLGAAIGSMVHYRGKLWINTFNGFVSLDPQTGETKRYSAQDGFSSNEANRYSVLATKKGLFIGTVNGLNYFDPAEIDSYTDSCQLEALSVSIFDEKEKSFVQFMDRSRFEKDKVVELPVESRFFQLNFSMPCFSQTNANFKYKLNGNPWVLLQQERMVRFENLSPGEYELEIAAFDLSGNKIGESLTFQIIALDFFYKRWWFLTGMLLLILYFIWRLYRSNIEKIKKEQALRTKIASDLHDEVGGILTGISMQAELLQTENPQIPKEHFFKKISFSSKKAVEAMGDVVWSIDSRNDDWTSLFARLREYVNHLFDGHNVQLHWEIHGEAPKTITQKMRQSIYLICKEAFNNSCKYSKATQIGFYCEFSRNQVRIKITDNGIGFDKEKGNSGQGLKNMKMRARYIKADFRIHHDNGTTVECLVPFAKKQPF